MSKKLLSLLIFSLLVIGVKGQNYKFGKISQEELMLKEHPHDKEANAAILYKNQRTFYTYGSTGFQLTTVYHIRLKIFNKDGFDWADIEIPLMVSNTDKERISRIKAVTYNLANNKIEETKLDRDDIHEEEVNRFREAVKFSMPNIKEGSIIEYEYKVYSPFIFNVPDINYQTLIPVDFLEAKFSSPEFFIFSKYVNPRANSFVSIEEGQNVFPDLDRKYNMTEYEILKKDIPALKVEPHVDHLNNYAGVVKWELQMTKFPNKPYESYSTTWEKVAETIFDEGGMKKEIQKSNFYEEDLSGLLQGVVDPMQKVIKIFNFIQDRVQWNNFIGYHTDFGTKKAYKEGKGNVADINLLLVSMLQETGIEANPVVLSTPANGIPLFPTRNGFNYVIAAVELDGTVYLMDASDKTSHPGVLPKRARNWQGRLIRNDGTSNWVNLYPSFFSEKSRTVNLTFDHESGYEGTQYNELTGLFAKNFREVHIQETQDELKDFITGKIANLEVKDFKFENLDNPGTDIKHSYKFSTRNGYEIIGDKLYLNPMLFGTTKENPFKADNRNYPIILDFPSVNSDIYNIRIPDDVQIISLPKSIRMQMENDHGEFLYDVKSSGNIIRIKSRLTFKNTIFNVNEYDALKNFYDGIIEKQNETIVLGKISKSNGSEEFTKSGR